MQIEKPGVVDGTHQSVNVAYEDHARLPLGTPFEDGRNERAHVDDADRDAEDVHAVGGSTNGRRR